MFPFVFPVCVFLLLFCLFFNNSTHDYLQLVFTCISINDLMTIQDDEEEDDEDEEGGEGEEGEGGEGGEDEGDDEE